MFERWGLQSPELTNILDLDVIIYQSLRFVKGLNEKAKNVWKIGTTIIRINKHSWLQCHYTPEFPFCQGVWAKKLPNIKTELLKHIGFKENPLSHSVFNNSVMIISYFFQIVK